MKTSKINSALIRNRPHYTFILFATWLILIIPLIDTKIIPGHDYVFHVTRILDIADGLEAGIFPLRVYADEAIFWGTPAGIFYPSLFLYIPAFLKVIGLPIEICYNLFIALVLLAGVVSSWLGFSLLTGSKKTGLFSATLFVSSGYYLSDAYVRSAVGELLGLSLMPLAIACIQIIITKSRVSNKTCILGILSISAIIQSHVLSCYFLILFTVVNLLVRYKSISRAIVCRILLFSMILFFLNANFIFPFLFFYKNVPVFIDYVGNFSQYGWPTIILMRFFVLWNFWLFIGIYLFLCLFRQKSFASLSKNLRKSYLKAYYPCFLAGLVFLILSDNAFPWDMLFPLKSLFEILQFPWRLLGPSALCFSICGGLAVKMLFRKKRVNNSVIFLSVCFICITNVISFYSFSPLPISSRWHMPEKVYWEKSLTPSYTDYFLYKDMNINELLNQGNHYISDATIKSYEKKGTAISFSYSAKTNSVITLPLIHYPGYVAEDQPGRKIEIKENNNHMIMLNLPEGNGAVKVWYKGLILFAVADYLSAFSVIGLLLLIFFRKDRLLFCLNKQFYADSENSQ